MKKLQYALVILALFLVGCGQKSATPKIYTSFYPVYDFTKKIVGDDVEVVNLTPPGVEAHDFELDARTMGELGDAKLVFAVGLHMEPWLENAEKNFPDVRFVKLSDGIATHEIDGVTDPHIWLSFENAKKMAETIADALSEIVPEKAEDFRARKDGFVGELAALQADYIEQTADLTDRTLVVTHAAFGYLADEIRFTQVPIEGLGSETEPDAATMRRVIDFVKAHKIPVIYAAEALSPKTAETVSRETGATVRVLDPVENLDTARREAGEDYLSIMKQNLATLLEDRR